MAKPDPSLLDPARYPHSLAIPPRYADLDTNQHINNIAISAMFEDARLRFVVDATSGDPQDYQVMVVSLAIEYLDQTHYPDPIAFHSAIVRIGRTSAETIQLATQQGRAVALARTVFVTTDGTRAIPIPAKHAATLSEKVLRP